MSNFGKGRLRDYQMLGNTVKPVTGGHGNFTLSSARVYVKYFFMTSFSLTSLICSSAQVNKWQVFFVGIVQRAKIYNWLPSKFYLPEKISS